jgi:hypothetical protein
MTSTRSRNSTGRRIDPRPMVTGIEIPQRSRLLPYRGVLSFRLEAGEASGSETAPRAYISYPRNEARDVGRIFTRARPSITFRHRPHRNTRPPEALPRRPLHSL